MWSLHLSAKRHYLRWHYPCWRWQKTGEPHRNVLKCTFQYPRRSFSWLKKTKIIPSPQSTDNLNLHEFLSPSPFWRSFFLTCGVSLYPCLTLKLCESCWLGFNLDSFPLCSRQVSSNPTFHSWVLHFWIELFLSLVWQLVMSDCCGCLLLLQQQNFARQRDCWEFLCLNSWKAPT